MIVWFRELFAFMSLAAFSVTMLAWMDVLTKLN